MKKKLFTLLISSLLGLTFLTGCGGSNPTPSGDDDFSGPGEDEVAEKLSLPTGNVTKFTLDQTDYSSRASEATKMIRILYHRTDNDDTYSNYEGWRIWAWDSSGGGNGWWYEFTKYNEFGVICEIPIEDVAANGQSVDKLGMVVTNCASQTATWEGSYNKDPDGDIMAEIRANNPGGVQNLYVKSKTVGVYYTQDSVFMSQLNYAYYSSMDKIHAVFATTKTDFKPYTSRFTLMVNGEEYKDFKLENFKPMQSNSSSIDLALGKKLNAYDQVTLSYRISSESINKVDILMTKMFDSDEFEKAYSYAGDDLGATFDNEANPTKTTFKVWSPVSKSMKLNVYSSGDYDRNETPENTYDMTMDSKGVWSYTVNADLTNKYYTYTVTNSLGTNEVVDPYAKSAGLNGRRGMVVNFTKLNQEIEGWARDTRPTFGNAVDASIYEIHVRDMTINPNSGVPEQYRGKFMGLAQTGTTYTKDNKTVKTGLDHLQELGVTHVQIQPMYDYSSVDESTLDTSMGKDNYNWGYDPLNYNCLEGSYSTNPRDGLNRIKEAKQMIMALHNVGIGIIMDVVYNHTSSLTGSNFELLVPNYYHRTRTSGVAYNGSGCGNEMASERFMVNKFFRESCQFWTDEYHLGGFRFDLMGLLDNQVMIDIYKDCSKIDSQIMVYGEPWTGGSTKLGSGTNPDKLTSQQTIQHSLDKSFFAGAGVYVGAFADGIRNAVRGDNSPGEGYVTGDKSAAAQILPGIQGMFGNGGDGIEPGQVINYVSCHDNYTLYDQIVQTIPSNRNLELAYSQAETIIFTAEGVPFMQEGEDFMRTKYDPETKKYAGNSYNVGDLINNMNYELKVDNENMFKLFKSLIAMRKSLAGLRLETRAKIKANMTTPENSNGTISYTIKTGSEELLVIHALNSFTKGLAGQYEVVFSNNPDISGSGMEKVTLSANTSVVFRKIA